MTGTDQRGTFTTDVPAAYVPPDLTLGQWRYPYSPYRNPRQMALHACTAQEILYGGAAGGGKAMPC